MVEKLKLWTTTAPSNTASKSRSLTARAGEAKATLRRVVSDSDLRSFGRSETSRLLKPPAPKLNEGLVGAPADLTHSVSQPEVSSAAGKAEQQETEKLEDTARDTSQSGSAIRMVSARKVLETRELLSGEARKLTAAAGRLRTFGRLKATAMASVAIRRMRVLAEAARQARGICSRDTPHHVLYPPGFLSVVLRLFVCLFVYRPVDLATVSVFIN